MQAIATAQGYLQSPLATGTYTLTPPGNGPAVSIVVTTNDQTMKLTPQQTVSFSTASGGSNVVYLDETQVYQPIEGFGAAQPQTPLCIF